MIREQIIQSVSFFVDAADKDDADLVAALVDSGFALKDAERLVAFVPVAFGRRVIERIAQVEFSPSFRINESGQEYALAKERVFTDAWQLAAESYESGLIPREQFASIALRSPELMAVNNALNSGSDITGAKFAAVVLWGYKTLGSKGWLQRVLG